jgi:hypothetical protein
VGLSFLMPRQILSNELRLARNGWKFHKRGNFPSVPRGPAEIGNFPSCPLASQVDDPEGAAFVYQYQSQPLADAMGTMHMHYGTAMLRISNGGCLAGDYYTGRDRRTFGRICCKRT